MTVSEWSERVELRRRLVHASGVGMPLIYLLELVDWMQLGIVIGIALLVVIVLEYARLVAGWSHAIFDRLTRPYEHDHVAGYALYMVGIAFAWLVFDPVPAIAGMLMLTLGDPVSGILSANDAGRRKRTTVIATMFLVCFGLAVPLTVPETGLAIGLVAAAAGAAGATVADGVTPVVRGYVVDDNLTIPPAAAAGISLAFALAGI